MALAADIVNALASVCVSIPDAVQIMRHCNESGNAIKSSSVEISGEAASESGATEKTRVITTASAFPTLDSDALITLSRPDGSGSAEPIPYIVTSLRTDPVGASMTVGLSDPLSKVSADYSGTRGQRRVRIPIDILAACNGRSTDLTDGYAPTEIYTWTICFPADSWPYQEAPQIGDELRFEKDGPQRVLVSRVTSKGGYHLLNCRSR